MRRFRVTARKFLYFQKRITKLGPAYYGCNEYQTSCTRKQAQPRQGCPTCEFSIQYKMFLKELERDLKLTPHGTRRGHHRWPVKMMLSTAIEIGSIAQSEEGINPRWPVALSTLVSIYRGESAKKQAIEKYVPPTGKPEVD